ncbi:MAG: hypothetical protein AAF664_19740, partial [Planctomycetota bacterium]
KVVPGLGHLYAAAATLTATVGAGAATDFYFRSLAKGTTPTAEELRDAYSGAVIEAKQRFSELRKNRFEKLPTNDVS